MLTSSFCIFLEQDVQNFSLFMHTVSFSPPPDPHHHKLLAISFFLPQGGQNKLCITVK